MDEYKFMIGIEADKEGLNAEPKQRAILRSYTACHNIVPKIGWRHKGL